MSAANSAIYPERKVVIGVAFGGPLAGGYYFWRTLHALGRPELANIVAIGSVLLLIITYATAFIPPFDEIPNYVFWGAQLGLTYGLYRGYLAELVATHVEAGGPSYGWANTLIIAGIALVLTVGMMLAVLYATGAFNGSSSRHYGKLQHEIVFDDRNIRPADVDKIGSALQTAGFFDEELQKTIDASKDGDRYVLTLYCNDSARDPEFMQLVRRLRSDVQKSFPTNPVIIDMVIGSPNNRIARIE